MSTDSFQIPCGFGLCPISMAREVTLLNLHLDGPFDQLAWAFGHMQAGTVTVTNISFTTTTGMCGQKIVTWKAEIDYQFTDVFQGNAHGSSWLDSMGTNLQTNGWATPFGTEIDINDTNNVHGTTTVSGGVGASSLAMPGGTFSEAGSSMSCQLQPPTPNNLQPDNNAGGGIFGAGPVLSAGAAAPLVGRPSST